MPEGLALTWINHDIAAEGPFRQGDIERPDACLRIQQSRGVHYNAVITATAHLQRKAPTVLVEA